ncbi:MAG: terpene cyclase/mutase family protein [Planctomycetia bacterium]|nr:terpene cyclase/mutase family protein [Planctomycetia bacterium]
MKRFLVLALLAALAVAAPARADDLPAKYRETVNKGLSYLAKAQHRDGHWEANGSQYPTSMTALAGLALLMEGSTMREGKYADNVRRAVDWLVDRSQRNGMIGNPNNFSEAQRYMYGHGFSLLFLASVYGEEEDGERRKKLEDILTRGVDFVGKAQTNRGGWGYVSAADGQNFDEGSVTITQLQGLRAARNAGIVVPKKVIDDAVKYLEKCTTPRGGVIYSLAHGNAAVGGERPPLTAAAVACAFSAGEYNGDLAKKWLKFCQTSIPVDKSGRDSFGHWEYTHFYYAQAVYILGDEGFAKLFPQSPADQRLTWGKYRETVFDYLASRQNASDGSWSQGHIGPVFTTACHLVILQLDNATLPIFQR